MKDKILSHLGAGHIWAGSIRYYETIDSTNTEAKRLAEKGAPHGTVLIADHQTAGRGRMGRSFHSPEASGIYLSVILRPDCPAQALSHLTCAVGSAMCSAVARTVGIRPRIKWINDLIVNNRKLGGILTELSLESNGKVNYAVVGIGINCNQQIADFPEEIQDIATSLLYITGKQTDRAFLIAQMIKELSDMSSCLLTEKGAQMEQYRNDCMTIGQDILVIKNEQKRYGKALDITEDGSLVVSYEEGETATVNAGEVHVRGLYGYC